MADGVVTSALLAMSIVILSMAFVQTATALLRRMGDNDLINADCIIKLQTIEANSLDALITDPPAGISFMGKDWDHHKGGRDQWVAWMTNIMAECLGVLKPGAHGLVWALPRTSHWTATALENAGFEIRDVVTHLFGTGFPKNLDISKAIDKAAGAQRTEGAREWKGGQRSSNSIGGGSGQESGTAILIKYDIAATDEAKKWQGFGTALKPASEHWILIRKPCSEKTVAANVLRWGVGGINIDASRIATEDKMTSGRHVQANREFPSGYKDTNRSKFQQSTKGRFPANLILDETAAEMLNEQSIAGGIHSAGKLRSEGRANQTNDGALFGIGNREGNGIRFGDSGGASRFFYVAKASKSDRGEGNNHPTVKASKLMEYLITLVTPPGGTILDPFMGSGSTVVAAKRLGFGFVGIEKEKEYFEIAERRIK